MEKKHKQLIIVILLFSVAGILVVKTIFKKQEPLIGPSPAPQEDTGVHEADMDFFELEDNLRESRLPLECERDPFNIYISAKKSLSRLTGIIYEEGVPVAIIDDIIVHEGEEIEEGVIVKKIGATNVILEKDGMEYTLELYTQ